MTSAATLIPEHQDERVLAPADLIRKAEQLVLTYGQKTMWYRHPEARIRFLDDIRIIILHLREYGGWEEWEQAQDLHKCLLHHCKKLS